MNIRYISRDSNILEENILEDNNTYVLSDHNTAIKLSTIIAKNKKDIFNYPIITDELTFKENIYYQPYTVIKEEKEVIFFFDTLTDKDKKLLNISNYFDCIDIAYNFYNTFSEFYEYDIKREDITTFKWQEEILNILYNIYNNMIIRIKKEKVIPNKFSNIFNNINMDLITNIGKITFINKLAFTPTDIKMINSIEKVFGKDKIELLLQLDEEDFDDDNLCLKSLNPKFNDKDIVVIEVNSNDSYLFILLDILNKYSGKDIEIYDNKKNEKVQYSLISQNYLNYSKNITLEETASYKIVELLVELLYTANKDKYSTAVLYKAYKNKDFIKFFDIKNKDINNLNDEINKKYTKYIEVPFLDTIRSFTSFYDLSALIENLSNYNDPLDKYMDIKGKIIEAGSEVINIQKFKKHSWNKYFTSNISGNLLKIFLKYIRAKKVEISTIDSEYKLNQISDITEMDEGKNIVFVNQQVEYNNNTINNFLLTKNQRKELGLPTLDSKKINDKYKMYKRISSLSKGKKIYLIYINDQNENITANDYIEEIMLENDIKKEIRNISPLLIKEYISNIFNMQELEKPEIDLLKVKKDDYRQNKIGVTSIKSLLNSPIDYYLNSLLINQKEDMLKNIENEIDARMIGNIIHQIFEELLPKYINNRNIDDEYIDGLVEKYKNKYADQLYEYKMPLYDITIFNAYKMAIKYFLNFLKDKNIENVEVEKQIELKLDNVTIKGTVDLMITIDGIKTIFDYKTGYLSKDQNLLKEALEQIDIYNNILENKYNLKIFSIFDNKILGINNLKDYEKVNMEEMIIILRRYFEHSELYYEFGKISNYSPFNKILKEAQNGNKS